MRTGGEAADRAALRHFLGAATMSARAQTRTSANQGFSLIELMVVVVIIGLLASMVIPNMTRMANRAKEAAVKQNMHLLQTAVEDFAVQSTGRYPTNALDTSDEGKTVMQLCPGAVYPENPFTHTASTVVWGVDPNASVQGQMGLNPATSSQYVIKGTGSSGALSTQLTTGS
jgi:general secretion pathway protein G